LYSVAQPRPILSFLSYDKLVRLPERRRAYVLPQMFLFKARSPSSVFRSLWKLLRLFTVVMKRKLV